MKAEDIKSNVMEHSSKYGFVHQSEDEKLLQDITRP